MTEALNSQTMALTPAAPLEAILRTDELLRRPSRRPDHQKENTALAALVSALADSPHTILQRLADEVLEVLDADSAGLSLLTKDGNRFYWAAIAGAWRPHLGGGTPRNFGPCGDVLDRNAALLFTHWERRYPYLSAAKPLAEEGLLVPFFVNGKAVGTIWMIAHRHDRKFDAEDQRLLESMGRFASTAYQSVESIEELKSATRVTSLGVLTASIAHAVNQPLSAIALNSESSLRCLMRDEPDIERVRLLTKRIAADAWRASGILERIHGMTCPQVPEKGLLSLNDLIDESLSFLREELQEKGIIMSLDPAPELPQIVGSRAQLQQVVVNLVINAVQAMAQLEPAHRRISIRTILSNPETVRCSIEDSGPGVDPNQLPRIFDTFFTTKDSGMGLDLTICQSIVEAHGGSIRASNDSALGGACFSFDLPAHREASGHIKV